MKFFDFKRANPANYPLTVQEIHNEFFTAGDILLMESERILNECEQFDKTKALILKDLGFTSTNEAKNLIEVQTKEAKAENTAHLVTEYRVRYPKYKFITEEIVGKICLKYSLVCGDVSLFKGFVPKKNLEQIQMFKKEMPLNNIAKCTPYTSLHPNEPVSFINLDTLEKGKSIGFKYTYTGKNGAYLLFQNDNTGYGNIGNGISGNIQVVGLQICAPLKDMDTKGMNLNGYTLEKHIPDPVVLQPIEGGYLIVTAWGDEASDPLVVNELNN